MNYLNFDLLVERQEAGYRVRVLNSPAGQATAISSLPLSELEIENFLLRIGRPRRGVRRLESPEMEAIRVFGKQLFEMIFSGEVRDRLRGSLAEAGRQGVGLRLQLRLNDVPELSELPWEFLFDPSQQQFLVLSAQTPVVRYLELPHQIQALTVNLPLKVIAMVSSPSDYPTLDVEREWERLKGSLAELEQRDLVRLDRLEAATLTNLQRKLRKEEYHIFHFIGHGGFDVKAQDGVLVLEDEVGRGRLVSGRYLGTLLHDERSLRLAVLNACEGARTSRSDPFSGAAHSLVQAGIPAVVAMQFEITDVAAITFAHEFYAALADGYPVDAALAESRKAIFAQNNDVEWGTPVLYLRAPDAHIFEISPKLSPITQPPLAPAVLPELGLNPDRITVIPGESAPAEVSLKNPGMVQAEYKLEIDGLPVDWLSGLPIQAEVPPGETLRIPLDFRPSRSPATRAGSCPFTLRAALRDVPEKIVEILATLTVEKFRDFSSQIQPQQLVDGGIIEVLINNQGNTPLDFDLHCSDSTNQLEFHPEQTKFHLTEGEETRTTFQVTPRQRPLLGGTHRIPYLVQVSAPSCPSQDLVGEVAVQSRVPLWTQLLMGIGLVLIIAFLAWGIFTGTPAIDQVSIQPEKPVAGESVTVSWEVRRASSIDLRPLVFDLDPELGQYTFEGGFEDQVSITVFARNSAGSDQHSITIPVRTPVVIIETETFTPSPSPTSSSTSTPTSKPVNTMISPKDEAVLVYIPAGEFLMGLSNDDLEALKAMCLNCDISSLRDQMPQNTIYLDSYWIDQKEVTNDQFARFVSETGHRTEAEEVGSSFVFPRSGGFEQYVEGANWQHPRGNGSDINGRGMNPVVQVSWEDANAYCKWAGRRLPTEAEWERAARGDQGWLFPWGNDIPSSNLLNFDHQNGDPVDVGSFPQGKSPFGLFDMAGNVWEWVSDFYGETYYQNIPDRNPKGPPAGDGHTLRGGSWASEQEDNIYLVATTYRLWNKPAISSNVIGFRCALDFEDTSLATTSITPTPESQGGLIAFHSNRTGNNDIYFVKTDGTDIQPVTFSPSHDQAPSWSPDGKQIAYQSNKGGDWEIHVINLENNEIQEVTSNDCNDYAPAWSPDGNQFVFYSDCDGNREIYTMDIDGSNRTQLTHDNSAYNWFPDWSNDGNKITFSSNRSGAYQIFVMNADGTNLHPLTTSGCQSKFSPDDQQIIYLTRCQGSGDIWMMNADGSNAQPLTMGEKDSAPSWSPDGAWIVFQRETSDTDFDIYIMNKDGDNIEQITSGPANDAAPVWQP